MGSGVSSIIGSGEGVTGGGGVSSIIP